MRDDEYGMPNPEPGWREESKIADEDRSPFFETPERAPLPETTPMVPAPHKPRKPGIEWPQWFEAQHRKGAPQIGDPVSVAGITGTVAALWSSQFDHVRGRMMEKNEIGYRIKSASGDSWVLYWPEDFTRKEASNDSVQKGRTQEK